MSVIPLIASTLGPTYNLPNAANLDDGIQVSVGTGVAALRAGPLPSVRLTGSYTKDRLTAQMSSTTYFGQNTEGFDIVGLRYQVISTEKFRLAPFVMAVEHRGPSDLDYRVTGRMGLAYEKGKGRLRLDGSIGLVGVQSFPYVTEQQFSFMTPLDTLLASETGLSLQLNENHWVRMGLMGPLPSLSHVWRKEKLAIKTTGGTMGTQHYLQVDVYPLR